MARKKAKAPKKQVAEVPTSPPVPIPESIPENIGLLQTTMADDLQNRMMNYQGKSKAACPECNAFPVVTEQRNRSKAVYRCRQCDFRWEEVR